MGEDSHQEKAWPRVLRAVARAGRELPGLEPGARVLAACSGGADSVVLARALAAVRGAAGLALAHVDHGLRPGSGRDRDHTAGLARELGVPFLCRELLLGPPPPGRTGETRARERRYQALADLAREWQAGAVATGHHASDQVETILFRILRGSGVAGLEGMPSARRLWRPDGPWVVRPLLAIPGATLRRAAAEEGFAFVEDPTNAAPLATRNRIRLELLPFLLDRFGPRVLPALEVLRRDAARVQAAFRAGGARLLAGARETRWGELRALALPLPGDPWEEELLLGAIHQALAALHPDRWIGAPPAFLEECRKLLRSRRAGTRTARRFLALAEMGRGELFLLLPPLPAPWPPCPLPLPGRAEPLPGLVLTAAEASPPDRAQLLAAAPDRVWLDRAGLRLPLAVRPPRPEDRFRPLGTAAPRRLADFLLSRRVPRWRRELQPLVVDATERILWVAGVEVAEEARLGLRTRAAVALALAGRS